MAKKYVSTSGKVIPADKVRPLVHGSPIMVAFEQVTAPVTEADNVTTNVVTTVNGEFVQEVDADAPAVAFDFRESFMKQHIAQRAALLKTLSG
jgi:hypothetical protein